MNTFALWFIGFYQRYLSPRKGFHCAHAAFFGGDSCSHAVKTIVLEQGVWAGRSSIRARFAECRVAAQALNSRRSSPRRQRNPDRDEGRRSSRRGNWLENTCDTLDFCDGPGKSCDCTPWN